MNIFYLDHDPVKSAEYHLDKHVVKMIIEYAQLLSTAHRMLDGIQTIEKKYVNGSLPARYRSMKRWKLEDERDSILYKATHANHPSAVWARAHAINYKYLYQLFCAVCDEYTYRYGKVHMTDTKLRKILRTEPDNIFMDNKTRIWLGPTPAMPDECKIDGDHLASYRKYYIDKKVNMAKWTKRQPPQWFIEGIKEKDAYVRLPMQELQSLFRRDIKNVGARSASISTM
jgi:hypothetical protein